LSTRRRRFADPREGPLSKARPPPAINFRGRYFSSLALQPIVDGADRSAFRRRARAFHFASLGAPAVQVNGPSPLMWARSRLDRVLDTLLLHAPTSPFRRPHRDRLGAATLRLWTIAAKFALFDHLGGAQQGTSIWGSQARAEWSRPDSRIQSVSRRTRHTPWRWPSRVRWPARMRTFR
jgi:hypothetical protein